jgi:glutamate 5-kinase
MQQLAGLRRDHRIEVVWVTSGAIASAVERTRYVHKALPEKQALSAIGQPLLMDLYNLSLGAVGLLGAQILLTYSDMADEKRRGNLKQTIEQLLTWEVVPILNENDAVATDEIKFGDNDSLSAKVAAMLSADRLILLTDVDGLFEESPKANPKAKLIPSLKNITDDWLGKVSSESGSTRGTGGMYSKLKAGQEATRAGIETWLVKGEQPGVLLQVARNEKIGTRLEA